MTSPSTGHGALCMSGTGFRRERIFRDEMSLESLSPRSPDGFARRRRGYRSGSHKVLWFRSHDPGTRTTYVQYDVVIHVVSYSYPCFSTAFMEDDICSIKFSAQPMNYMGCGMSSSLSRGASICATTSSKYPLIPLNSNDVREE